MLRYGIAQFVGSWLSESGHRLRIEKVRRDRAVVDFLDPRGAPITRPVTHCLALWITLFEQRHGTRGCKQVRFLDRTNEQKSG